MSEPIGDRNERAEREQRWVVAWAERFLAPADLLDEIIRRLVIPFFMRQKRLARIRPQERGRIERRHQLLAR
jgi:hypothetical protein